jgi:hypothetical protein
MRPFLSDPVPAPLAPPRSKTVTDYVRDDLLAAPAGEWHTLRAIADRVGLTLGQVNGAVYGLIGIGVVERKESAHAGRHKRGQAYRWRG